MAFSVVFWTVACVIAFVLPVVGWKYLRNFLSGRY
jgi:hypothetical protein